MQCSSLFPAANQFSSALSIFVREEMGPRFCINISGFSPSRNLGLSPYVLELEFCGKPKCGLGKKQSASSGINKVLCPIALALPVEFPGVLQWYEIPVWIHKCLKEI